MSYCGIQSAKVIGEHVFSSFSSVNVSVMITVHVYIYITYIYITYI